MNASADRYVDLQVDGQPIEIVALDRVPLAYHDPSNPSRKENHVLVSPAGRLEGIVVGPPSGAHAKLRTLCVNTGPDGDPNPEMVLADIVPAASDEPLFPKSAKNAEPPPYKVLDLSAKEQSEPDFVVTFTEDKKGFYIIGAESGLFNWSLNGGGRRLF